MKHLKVEGTPEDTEHVKVERYREKPESENEEQGQSQALSQIVERLSSLAQAQEAKKREIENEALDDLRQYYGRYDADTEAKLKATNRTRVFGNITRPTVHAWEAWMVDLLFPVDDKPWAIEPTPVPELVESAKKEAFEAWRLVQEANIAQQQGDMQAAVGLANKANEHAGEALRIQMEMDIAKKKSDNMARTIEDQLVETDWGAKCRRQIHDAILLGTGIKKGPLARNKSRKKWEKKTEPDPVTGQTKEFWSYSFPADDRPHWEYVDWWDFFPDMTGRTPKEWSFTFERHVENEQQIRALLKEPGFDEDAIYRLLKSGARDTLPTYMGQLADIAGRPQPEADNRFIRWEYHGPLTNEDVNAIAQHLSPENPEAWLKKVGWDEVKSSVYAIVHFCGSELLKIGPHPNDDGETLYDNWWLIQDNASSFGFGVPRLLRDPQAAFNGAWRMTMENGGVSARPHTIIDQQQVQKSADGVNTWYRTGTASNPNRPAIEVVQVPNNLAQLMQVMEVARKLADEEGMMPTIARGEQGSHVTQTKGGMAMLMNSNNIIKRLAVKNWDDYVTVPNIQRMFDWNMEFNPDDTIKGDMKIVARGSSTLLIREMQAPNAAAIAQTWTVHPKLGPMVRERRLAEIALKTNMMPADILKSEDELKQEEMNRQPPPDPEMEKLKVQLQIAQIDAQSRKDVANMNMETAMMRLAAEQKMTVEELRTRLDIARQKSASDERKLAAEIGAQTIRDQKAAQKVPVAPSGGGTV